MPTDTIGKVETRLRNIEGREEALTACEFRSGSFQGPCVCGDNGRRATILNGTALTPWNPAFALPMQQLHEGESLSRKSNSSPQSSPPGRPSRRRRSNSHATDCLNFRVDSTLRLFAYDADLGKHPVV